MTTGTGLSAQIGFAAESVVGTGVTPTRFLEFDSESLGFVPGWIEPSGLRVGVKFKRGQRLVLGRQSVAGDVALQVSSRGMGVLFKQMLGSAVTAPAQVSSTSAYKQVHQTGDHMGKSLTVQVGRPEPSATVRPHTFSGCKIPGWEFTLNENDTARLSLTFDGWAEDTSTALASASYVDSDVFDFTQVQVLEIGGTVTGTTELSVTGSTSVSTVCKGITFTGATPLDTERYSLTGGGVKKEQLENDTPTITGTLTLEYNQTEWYAPFRAGDRMPLHLRLQGNLIETGNYDVLDFLAPEIRIKTANPVVAGPGVTQMAVEFEVYSDGTRNPFQVTIISKDTAL